MIGAPQDVVRSRRPYRERRRALRRSRERVDFVRILFVEMKYDYYDIGREIVCFENEKDLIKKVVSVRPPHLPFHSSRPW